MTKSVIPIGNGLYLNSYTAVEGIVSQILETVNSCKNGELICDITLKLLRNENRDEYYKLTDKKFSLFAPVEDSFNYNENIYKEHEEYAYTEDERDLLKIRTCLNLLEIYKPMRYA